MSTYHLRGQSANIECSVIFLDSSSSLFEINGQSPGSALYDKVINHLEVRYAPLRIKRELFGLQYKDTDETTKWLDLNSKLRKQLGGSNGEPVLEFRVHFFVSTGQIETLDDCSLKMYFLQLRTMLQQGVLKPRSHDAARIGALVAQIEIGDYKEYFNDYEQGAEYLSQIIIYPEQERKPDLLNRIAEEHKKLKGMELQLATRSLVELVSRVERYGIEIHCAKSIINPNMVLDTFERPDTLIEIGVSSEGICVFKNGIKDEQDLAWKHIDKIQCNSKQFILVIQSDNDPDQCFKIDFTFTSSKNCKACFLSCQAHHQFFQSQLSIEPSTSSAYAHTNTEFLCRSSSILKTRFKIGGSTSSRKPRRQSRYLQSSSSREVSSASRSLIGSSCTDSVSNRTSTGHDSSTRTSMTVPPEVQQQLNVRISNNSSRGDFFSPQYPSRQSPMDPIMVAGSSTEMPYRPNLNNPFTSQSWTELCTNAGPSGHHFEPAPSRGPFQNPPEGYPYDYYQYLAESQKSPPFDEESNHSWSDDDDGYQNVSPYFVGERPDPIQLPSECNTTFHPQIDLEGSMYYLAEQLRNPENLDEEFQQTVLLRTEFTVNNAVLPENRDKNRYQDILPYDRSRVILKNRGDGDYINANHLIMILPENNYAVEEKINYIAAQGPLEETITDFWRMIWEQNCSIVVMLTNVLEQTMSKCHPYWPSDTNSVLQCGNLRVSCESPPIEENYVTTREIFLSDSRYPDQCPREIHLLHYTKWPDKKCPENSEDFLAFVERVRTYRAKFLGNAPLVVHCSAGIGRTGVFIVVETACRLIELNKPVLPLDLVRVLRDQRPYMIQTSEQFSFVCRAILTYYEQFIDIQNRRSSALMKGAKKASSAPVNSLAQDQNYKMRQNYAKSHHYPSKYPPQ